MKKYRVVVTEEAQKDLRGKLAYIRKKLRNPQAVKNVYADYKLARKELEKVAGTIHEPDSEVLKLRKSQLFHAVPTER